MLGGFRFEVDRVRLAEASFIVEATADGPLPALHGPAALFGEDGQGIVQTWEYLETPRIRRGGDMTLILPCRFSEIIRCDPGTKVIWA